MTVSNTTRNIREEGNGSKTAFDFPFKIFAATDLKVYKIVRATDAETLMVLTTDYTVSINTSSEGGTVTFVVAPTALQDSFIKRQLPRTQDADIPTESNFPEQTLEDIADRQAMILIEQDEELARAVQASEFSSDPDAPSSEELAELVEDATDAAAEAAVRAAAAEAAQAAAEAAAAEAEAAGLAVKIGSFTRDLTLANGTQEITGVGFTPKVVLFFANISGNAATSIGADIRTAMGSIANGHNNSADTWLNYQDRSITLTTGAGVNNGAVITTLGADGFTLTWTKSGSPSGTATVTYVALA